MTPEKARRIAERIAPPPIGLPALRRDSVFHPNAESMCKAVNAFNLSREGLIRRVMGAIMDECAKDDT